ncbi:MAG: MoaD/ThiS family protein [Nitrospirota bacterium]|nr:MoaD/ThiS family protein [Nitrospirota bacterium]MDE3118243.1 MoaD/ThiS family protein [Nitrospirota bacterium]MDE3225549.1 MoaD/ThiS family protein [Nitrospirota bacterium]MDE3244014.1 MoaD/ThiS family protein [Nitrospirota bacterium]
MTVHIPSALRSYTGQKSEVEAEGRTLAEVLSVLDGRHPGLRFRIVTEQDQIRPHIRIFVNETQVQALETRLGPDDQLYIVLALSGG